MQFITGTTVDPPANNSGPDEEEEDNTTPWVYKVDWGWPYDMMTPENIFGPGGAGKNMSQFSG